MIKPDRQTNYDELGFWKHFAFVRFIYTEYLFYKEEFLRVHMELAELQKLTENIKSSNNREVEVITPADESDDDFYRRKDGELVEDFLSRIGTSQPKTKTARSANDIIEDAKRKHVRQYNEQLEKVDEAKQKSKTNVVVADSAIDKIGKEIKKLP